MCARALVSTRNSSRRSIAESARMSETDYQMRPPVWDPLEAADYLENCLLSSSLTRWFEGPTPLVSPSQFLGVQPRSIGAVLGEARKALEEPFKAVGERAFYRERKLKRMLFVLIAKSPRRGTQAPGSESASPRPKPCRKLFATIYSSVWSDKQRGCG